MTDLILALRVQPVTWRVALVTGCMQPVMWLVARVAEVACNLSCDWLQRLQRLHATCHVTGCTHRITSVRHKLSLDPFPDYCWRCSLSSKSCCGMLHRELLHRRNMNPPVQNKSFSPGFLRDQYHLLHLRTAAPPHLHISAFLTIISIWQNL